ncbi:MAG: Glucose-1-phosphate adenylyltransferase [Chlamydiae bacterium]|nr:Glucose-1-phosphate adenylyltransferase [Chlamydiota bacterium]
MNNVTCIILAGGKGTRLYPLTKNRAKPAVTFGGRIKLIDIPIHLAKTAKIEDIYILTQYLASSIHEHIDAHYMEDKIELICPNKQENIVFEGTADAIRKNLHIFEPLDTEYFLVLSGDHVYDFDFKKFIDYGIEKNADMLVMCKPVNKTQANRLGILQIDPEYQISNFVEKPQDPNLIETLLVPDTEEVLGSMGIYLFKKETLINLLQEDQREDFGKHLIPSQIKKGKSFAYAYDGYWEDIGTIKTFFQTSLDLTKKDFNLKKKLLSKNFYHLPKPTICTQKLQNSIICEGTKIEAQEIKNTILGIGSVVKKGSLIKDSIILGSHELDKGSIIGENCMIKNTIIDQNVNIGNNVELLNKNNLSEYEDSNLLIKDGIIVVKENASIPDGFSI